MIKTIHNLTFLLFSKNTQNCSFKNLIFFFDKDFNIYLLAIKIDTNLKKYFHRSYARRARIISPRFYFIFGYLI